MIFSHFFKLFFSFKTCQRLEDGRLKFLNIKFAEKEPSKLIKDWRKTSIWAKAFQSWLFVTFAILTVKFSHKNTCKQDKLQEKFSEDIFENPNGFGVILIWNLCSDAFTFITTFLFSAIFIIWEENHPLNGKIFLRLLANW